MRFFSKKPISPKETGIPRVSSDITLDLNIDQLRSVHKEFTKLLEDFISGVQQKRKGDK